GVTAVPAHVPFTDRAGRTRDRVGASDDTNDEIARCKTATLRCLFDDPKRLMADDQLIGPRRGPAISAFDDFQIGTADAERPHPQQGWAVANGRRSDVFEVQGIWFARRYS